VVRHRPVSQPLDVSASTGTVRSRRNVQLDFLRGIAVLLVIGKHLGLPETDGVPGMAATVVFRIGWLGVDLFFVLSGFLIGGLLLGELKAHGRIDVWRFYVRRGFKLYPLYFVFLLYVVLVPAAKAVVAGASAGGALGDQLARYWPNFVFLQNYVGPNPATHTWSLGVEEHFYLLLPLALVLLQLRRLSHRIVPLCLAGIPVCLALRSLAVATEHPWADTMFASHLRFDALLLGVAIRAGAEAWPAVFAGLGRRRVPLLAAGIVLWAPNLVVPTSTAWVRTAGLTMNLLGSAAFLLAAYHTHRSDIRVAAPLVHRFASTVAWIGVYSYAVYLWHVTVTGMLGRDLVPWITSRAGGWTGWTWLASVVVLTSCAVLGGFLASVAVEGPMLRLRDRMFPSRSASLPSSAS
jgi:peptidoglycan/LPS O-acetylase OafA/YrhL